MFKSFLWTVLGRNWTYFHRVSSLLAIDQPVVGVVSAERLFRCPPRYLFDPVTRLCQRRERVTCEADQLFYAFRDLLTVQLTESQLGQFFSQPLTISGTIQDYNAKII